MKMEDFTVETPRRDLCHLQLAFHPPIILQLDSFGMLLGCFWDVFGMFLGCFWDAIGILRDDLEFRLVLVTRVNEF